MIWPEKNRQGVWSGMSACNGSGFICLESPLPFFIRRVHVSYFFIDL